MIFLSTPLFSRVAYAILRTDTVILIFGYSPFAEIWNNEVGFRLDLVPFYFFLILFLWQLCSACSCSAGHLAPASRQPCSSSWSAPGACPSWLIGQLLLWICYSEQSVVRLAARVLPLYF
jgi:hypothetical protein